ADQMLSASAIVNMEYSPLRSKRRAGRFGRILKQVELPLVCDQFRVVELAERFFAGDLTRSLGSLHFEHVGVAIGIIHGPTPTEVDLLNLADVFFHQRMIGEAAFDGLSLFFLSSTDREISKSAAANATQQEDTTYDSQDDENGLAAAR